MDNDIDSHDTDLQRLCDDAMQQDYPPSFNSREAWDAYNEMLDRRYRERAHLKGATLISDETSF